MALEHVFAGPVTVLWDTIELGYSRDGVQIRIDPRWIEIPSDDYGGASGPPSDAQLIGATASVTCDLTKYDATEVHKLTAFSRAGGPGILPAFGSLMRQESYLAVLKLDGVKEDWTFSNAIVKQAFEINKGTRFSSVMLGFECWVDSPSSRVLFQVGIE